MLAEIAVALALPGWRLRRRAPQIALVLLVGGWGPLLAAAGYALLSGRSWVALTLDARFLGWLMVAGIFALVSRLAAVAEVAVTEASARDYVARDLWALLVVSAVLIPMLVVVVEIGQARADIAPAFAHPAGQPLFDAAAPIATVATTAPTVTTAAVSSSTTTTLGARRPAVPAPTSTSSTTTTLPPKPARPRSGVDPALLADVVNVLLLGGDAGPDRQGLRTDSMMVFSLHRPSGRAGLLSIPRDLRGLLFPPGTALEQRYPYGFTERANAVYPIVSYYDDLRAAYDVVEGVRPGVVATAQAIGYSLDVTIDDYVLIDMQGFLELIDALGGVTVDVDRVIPMPGNVPGAPTQYPDTIGPGLIHMDGSTALGYVRSRKGDTDFLRAARQRDLLEALATQISLGDVIGSFGSVASAIGGTLRTSLTTDELADILRVIGGETAIVESVGLVPPLIDIARPDVAEMARISGAVRLAVATGTPSGY